MCFWREQIKDYVYQHKPRTRKITYHLVGQNQFFSLTMKNGIIIFILIVSSPAIVPLPTSIFHVTFSLSLSSCYFYLYKIYLLISFKPLHLSFIKYLLCAYFSIFYTYITNTYRFFLAFIEQEKGKKQKKK